MMALIAGWSGTGISGEAESVEDLISTGRNPAFGSATILLSPGSMSDVELQVFDLSGRLVSTLLSGTPPDGQGVFRFDPAEPGVYLVRCSADGFVDTERLAVLR
jgi:hypothetical protein